MRGRSKGKRGLFRRGLSKGAIKNPRRRPLWINDLRYKLIKKNQENTREKIHYTYIIRN